MKRDLYQPLVASAPAVAASVTTRTEDEKWIAQFEGELHCAVCGKIFTRRAALAVHSVKCKPVLKDSKEQGSEPAGPLRCGKCGKEFTRRAVLTSHSQSCTGPDTPPLRAHACRFCGRAFPRRRPLEMHLPRCPRAPPRSPLRHLITPPKLTAAPNHLSPSAIQVRRDYNKLLPLTTDSCAHLPKRPMPAKLEAVVRKLHERPCNPPAPPPLLRHTVHRENKSPTRSPNPTQKTAIVNSPMNRSRFLISPLAMALQNTATSVSQSAFFIAATIDTNTSSGKLTVRTVSSPLGEMTLSSLSPCPIPLIDLEPPLESLPDAAISGPEAPASPSNFSLPQARAQKQCTRVERSSFGKTNIESDLDDAEKVEDPSRMDVTSSTDNLNLRTDAAEQVSPAFTQSTVEVNHCTTRDCNIVRLTERGDASINNPELLQEDAPSTYHESRIPVSFCSDESDSRNGSSVSLVQLPLGSASTCTAELESNMCPTKVLDTEPESNTSRPPSTPVFVEPTTPGITHMDSPAPNVMDTLSDIELHRDSASFSPVPLTEELRQETDSDIISLTSRGTERSEDSCTPPVDPPSCLLADDSGVSDDGCLPEVVEEGKYSNFRGFDTLVQKDHLPKIRLESLISNLNDELEVLSGKECSLTRAYANGKRLLFLDKNEVTNSQL